MFLAWTNKRGCQYQRQKDKTEREREDVKKCIFFKVCWGCFINIKAEDWELPTTCRCFSEWSEWNFLREKSNNSHSRILYSVHFQFSSVQLLSCLTLCDPMDHSMPDLHLSEIPGVYSNSCPLSRWCHPTISSSVIPFSSCPQSLPASGSFPMSQLFASVGKSTGVTASASVLPMNTQDWSPLGWTGWISLQSKGLSRIFPNTKVQKYQLFCAQLSSQSNSHIHTWPLEKP